MERGLARKNLSGTSKSIFISNTSAHEVAARSSFEDKGLELHYVADRRYLVDYVGPRKEMLERFHPQVEN